MKRFLLIGFAWVMMLSVGAQSEKSSLRSKTQTPHIVKKQKAQLTTSNKKKPQQTKNTNAKNNATAYTNVSIKKLQNERSAIQKKIKQQEQALKANKEDVAKRLKDLLLINGETSLTLREFKKT